MFHLMGKSDIPATQPLGGIHVTFTKCAVNKQSGAECEKSAERCWCVTDTMGDRARQHDRHFSHFRDDVRKFVRVYRNVNRRMTTAVYIIHFRSLEIRAHGTVHGQTQTRTR